MDVKMFFLKNNLNEIVAKGRGYHLGIALFFVSSKKESVL
jgi:hypothetical protein